MPTVTLSLIRRSSISNSSELFSYTTMYSNLMFLELFLFSYRAKTHTHKHGHTHTDSNEYPIVAFSKNATITSSLIVTSRHKLLQTLDRWHHQHNKMIHKNIIYISITRSNRKSQNQKIIGLDLILAKSQEMVSSALFFTMLSVICP